MKSILVILSIAMFVSCSAVCFGQETSVIEKKLVDLLRETYGRRDIQIKLESVPAYLKQGIKIKSVNLHRMPEAGGKGLAVVEVEGEDGSGRASYIPFRVYEKRMLFYAKRALSKGSSVSADDLGSRETYVSESEHIYPKELQDIIGKVLKKDAAPGTILTLLIVDNPQVIRRGEVVTIVGENAYLSVRTKGKAEEQGRLGERIRVKNLSSGREVVGTVADNRLVMVEF